MCDTATSHTCLLCMGSNLDALLHLKNAEDALQRLFPDIEWGGIVETVPEKMENPQPFLNRAARFRTSLDIDLLSYDQQVLKPEDWQKEYVRLAFRHANFT